MGRNPMTPAEFDDACRLLWQAHPELSETSSRRSVARNAAVGGHVASKHVLGMARDFVATMPEMEEALQTALSLGFWCELHDAGTGDHLHVQGLPPGPVAEWWEAKYGRRESAE